MKLYKETTSIEGKADRTAKRSVVIPVILIFICIIAFLYFGICTFAGMKYTTFDYYNTLIKKCEVSSSPEKAVEEAKHMIFVIRACVAFGGVALVLSVTGLILCVKTIIKRIKFKKQLRHEIK